MLRKTVFISLKSIKYSVYLFTLAGEYLKALIELRTLCIRLKCRFIVLKLISDLLYRLKRVKSV